MAEKLHQLIAAQKHVRGALEKIFAETMHIFGKPDKMQGLTKEYTPFDEDGRKFPNESKEIVTTARDRLSWMARPFIKLVNWRATRDAANCEAKAPLKFNGVDFGELPVSTLLELEDLLPKQLRPVYSGLPTRDMTKKWEPTDKDNICKHGPVDTFKTEKITTPVTMYEATKEHPAQVEKVVTDRQIGKVETTYFSGEESPQFKADCLTNIDGLIVAIKKARCQANEVEVKHISLGEKLIRAIEGETKQEE